MTCPFSLIFLFLLVAVWCSRYSIQVKDDPEKLKAFSLKEMVENLASSIKSPQALFWFQAPKTWLDVLFYYYALSLPLSSSRKYWVSKSIYQFFIRFLSVSIKTLTLYGSCICLVIIFTIQASFRMIFVTSTHTDYCVDGTKT